ncbi:MAG: RNA polymerase sigma factor [Roseibacillus sp.]
MTEEEEINCTRRTLDGDVDAFSALVDAYQQPLIRMLATILHDKRRLAEDVAQDVLVEAFRRLRDFDPVRSRFSTWLFMIARSRGINAMNRMQPTLFAEPPESSAKPSPVDERADLSALDIALHQLPPKQKRAFVLAVIEDLPHAEVARIESTTIGTIKSRVSRARDFLKTALETANR